MNLGNLASGLYNIRRNVTDHLLGGQQRQANRRNDERDAWVQGERNRRESLTNQQRTSEDFRAYVRPGNSADSVETQIYNRYVSPTSQGGYGVTFRNSRGQDVAPPPVSYEYVPPEARQALRELGVDIDSSSGNAMVFDTGFRTVLNGRESKVYSTSPHGASGTQIITTNDGRVLTRPSGQDAFSVPMTSSQRQTAQAAGLALGSVQRVSNTTLYGQQGVEYVDVNGVAQFVVGDTIVGLKPNGGNYLRMDNRQNTIVSPNEVPEVVRAPLTLDGDSQATQGYTINGIFWMSADGSEYRIWRDGNFITEEAWHAPIDFFFIADEDGVYPTHSQPMYYGPAYQDWAISDIHVIAAASQPLYSFGIESGYFTEALIEEARRTGNLDLAMQNLAGQSYASNSGAGSQIAVRSYPSMTLQNQLGQLEPRQQESQGRIMRFVNRVLESTPLARPSQTRDSIASSQNPNDRVIIMYHGDDGNSNLGSQDAQDMVALYRDLGYAPEQITQLKAPTRQQLEAAFTEAREQGGQIDFYAATHGAEVLSRDEDMDMMNAPEGTGEGAISLNSDEEMSEQELYSLFGNQTGRIIIDACHSGSFVVNNENLPEGILPKE
jgi:hypothetical protein